MDVITYCVIVACYGLGCALSWRAGFSSGMKSGIEQTIDVIAKLGNTTPRRVLEMIMDARGIKRSRPAA